MWDCSEKSVLNRIIFDMKELAKGKFRSFDGPVHVDCANMLQRCVLVCLPPLITSENHLAGRLDEVFGNFRVVTVEAGRAQGVLREADGLDQIVFTEIADGVRADGLGDLLQRMFCGGEIPFRRGVEAVKAWIPDGKIGRAHV